MQPLLHYNHDVLITIYLQNWLTSLYYLQGKCTVTEAKERKKKHIKITNKHIIYFSNLLFDLSVLYNKNESVLLSKMIY